MELLASERCLTTSQIRDKINESLLLIRHLPIIFSVMIEKVVWNLNAN